MIIHFNKSTNLDISSASFIFWSLSSICNSGIVTDFPFSRETLAEDGKQWIYFYLPVWTLSPICISDIVTEFPVSRENLAVARKHSRSHVQQVYLSSAILKSGPNS